MSLTFLFQFRQAGLAGTEEVDVDLTDSRELGWAPLQSAAAARHAAVVKALLDKGAAVNVSAYLDLKTPLHRARTGRQRRRSSCWRAAAADVGATAAEGWTALHEAAERGHASTVAVLLARVARSKVKTAGGQTALAQWHEPAAPQRLRLWRGCCCSTQRPRQQRGPPCDWKPAAPPSSTPQPLLRRVRSAVAPKGSRGTGVLGGRSCSRGDT